MTNLDTQTKTKRERYNIVSKNIAHAIGANITPVLCLLLPFLLIGFIWTDFGEIVFSTSMISDGIVMAMLLITGYTLATRLGKDGGKLDEEYIKAKSTYAQLIEKVSDMGTLLLGDFCSWQVDLEYEKAINIRLKSLKMTDKEWEAAKAMSCDELIEKYGKIKGKKIDKLKTLPPIELNETILLYSGVNDFDRGGITPSAEENLHSRRHFTSVLLTSLFTSIVTISCVISVTQDISFAKVIYTLFKLVLLLAQMARGYERGAHAYNTVEVMHLNSKSAYLREYLLFMGNETYKKIFDKYKEEKASSVEEDIYNILPSI